MSKKARTDEGPRLFHMKVAYCGKIASTPPEEEGSLQSFLIKLFEPKYSKENKCPVLVTLEKGEKGREHWHMQGTTTLSEKQIKNVREEICKHHSLTLEKKRQIAKGEKASTPHPTSRSTKEVTAAGLQYMVKKDAKVIFKAFLKDSQIAELREKSAQHVEGMKKKVEDHVGKIEIKWPHIANMQAWLLEMMHEVLVSMRALEHKTSPKHFKVDLLKSLINQAPTREHQIWLEAELYGFKH